jgi:RNAse (barnase) inhibitor barstar
MSQFIIDRKNIKTEKDIHVKRPCHIIWMDFEISKKNVGSQIDEFVRILKKVEASDLGRSENKFTIQII